MVSLTTPTLCEVWKSAAIHSISPTLQLVKAPPNPTNIQCMALSGTEGWTTESAAFVTFVTNLSAAYVPLERVTARGEEKTFSRNMQSVQKQTETLELLSGWKAA